MSAVATIAIEYRPGEDRAAALDTTGNPIEFRVEHHHMRSMVGGIFLGRVRSVRPEIGAAFIDIGMTEHGFLNIKSSKGKRQIACDIRGAEIKEGAAVVVQVDRDPEAGKGARLTLNVNQPDRGAVNKDAACPSCIIDPPSLPARVLRDWVTPETGRIIVDHDRVLGLVQQQLNSADVECTAEIVRDTTAFEHLEIDDIFDDQHSPVIKLPGGGSIIVEHTSAMTTVDVNVGEGQEANASRLALQTNLEAATEIAAALRRRGIGGLIAIDFLKMNKRAENENVVSALRHALADDPANPQTTGMSAFGIVEVARQRQYSSLFDVQYTKKSVPTATTRAIDALHQVRVRRGTSAKITASREIIAELNGPLKTAKTDVEAELGFAIQLETVPEATDEGYSVR